MLRKRLVLWSIAVILLLMLSAAGQNNRQNNKPDDNSNSQEAILKIDTNLIQIDAVVTDKNGQLVTDLKPEEFEIYEDGHQQKLTNFSYISLSSPSSINDPSAKLTPSIKNVPTVSPAVIRPEQVRRTTALLVDDLALSFENIAIIKTALKKYISENLQPGDFVAIVSTSGKLGLFQQFTTDKQQLLNAIDRINLAGFKVNSINNFFIDPGFLPPGEETVLRGQILDVGLLNTMEYVVQGLRRLPGRKSLVLFSEGFFLRDDDDRLLPYFRRLTDLATRSSVVIYTADARGLTTTELSAGDDVGFAGIINTADAIEFRKFAIAQQQDSLKYLADQTGGIYFNSNDIKNSIKRAIDDQNGFYLLGYDPDESTFKLVKGKRTFHKLEIKVKRAGLTVRTRQGFLGTTDTEAKPVAPRTRAEQLVYGLSSPFTAIDLNLRLTTLFAHEEAQDVIHSLICIDGQKLTFTDDAEGWHKSEFDILAVAYGEDGQAIYQINKTHNIRVKDEDYQRINRDGFLYIVNVPVKKSGAYQLRVVVRDSASEKLGSASQFVIVPNLKKGNLSLSGILVNSSDPKAAQPNAKSISLSEDAESNNLNSAIRKFQGGMVLNYLCHIYNVKLERNIQRPQIRSQARLFHNGQLYFTGNELDLSGAQKLGIGKYLLTGRLQLGTEMEAGSYTLELTVTDSSSKKRMVKQIIDFEIVK